MSWTYCRQTGKFSAFVSDIQGFIQKQKTGFVRCPKCRKNMPVVDLTCSQGRMLRDGEIVGWQQRHGCGASLIVFND